MKRTGLEELRIYKDIQRYTENRCSANPNLFIENCNLKARIAILEKELKELQMMNKYFLSIKDDEYDEPLMMRRDGQFIRVLSVDDMIKQGYNTKEELSNCCKKQIDYFKDCNKSLKIIKFSIDEEEL